MRGLVTVQSLKQIGSGNGLLQIGTSALNLQGVGSLEGSTTETTTREVLQLWDGTPQLLVHEEVSKETAKITCTLKEKNIKILCRQLGLDPLLDIETVNASTITVGSGIGVSGSGVTGEEKTLWEENWNYLYYQNILSATGISGWSGTSPIVALKATPQAKLTETTDYIVDYVAGAIRRVAGGAIADGDDIIMTYKAQEGLKGGLHTGGTMWRTWCYIRFVYPVAWGGRQITEYAKAFPSPETVQSYQSGNWNMRELSFEAAGDMRLAEGSRIRKQYFEAAVTAY